MNVQAEVALKPSTAASGLRTGILLCPHRLWRPTKRPPNSKAFAPKIRSLPVHGWIRKKAVSKPASPCRCTLPEAKHSTWPGSIAANGRFPKCALRLISRCSSCRLPLNGCPIKRFYQALVYGYWPFNEESGQYILDLSPNNRNGTLGQSDNIDDDPTWQSFGAPIGSCVDESCEYRSSDGDFSTFIKHTDDTYTRTLRNGTRYEYDAQGLQTAMVDRNGHRTDYHYDGQDRLKEIIDPVGKKFTLTYDANGYLDSVEDPAQRTTTFEHDTAGDLVKVTFPDQNEREFGYDSRHLMLTESNERGDLTDRSYDFSGRLVHTFLPDQAQRRSVNSQATGLIDPATYDDSTGVPFIRSQEAVSTFTDGENRTRTVITNGFGSATQIEDATGLIVNIERDEHNLPTRLDYAPGTNKAFSVIQTFDSDRGTRLSRRESFDIDGETETRGMEYGYHAEFNLITRITEVWGALEDEHRVAYTTTLMRDAQGNLEKIINPLDHETTLVPDGFGRIERLTTPNGRVVDYDYYDGQDENGMLYTITETPPDGSPQRVTTITQYHADGQPQTIVSADGVEWTLDYDLRGRLERITDPLDQQVVYRYDEDCSVTLRI